MGYLHLILFSPTAANWSLHTPLPGCSIPLPSYFLPVQLSLFTKDKVCGVSDSNEWVQVFHKWKVNAELYRMGFIFDLFLCQWGYVMEFSTSPIGIYLECYLSAEVIWNLSRSREWSSQYSDLRGNTSDSIGVVLPSESGMKSDAKLCWLPEDLVFICNIETNLSLCGDLNWHDMILDGNPVRIKLAGLPILLLSLNVSRIILYFPEAFRRSRLLWLIEKSQEDIFRVEL